jgi:hypothetical protein
MTATSPDHGLPDRLEVSGYQPKTFFERVPVIVRRLSIHSSYEPEGPDGTTSQSLSGWATLEDHEFTLIGAKAPRPAELRFVVTPSTEGPVEYWELEALAEDPATNSRLLAYLRHAYRQFADRRPSVAVNFMESLPDVEGITMSGTGDWEIRCEVPEEVFTALRDDLLAGRCNRLELSFQVVPTFVPKGEHHDPEGHTVGVLQTKTNSCCRGWIESFGWRPVPVKQLKVISRATAANMRELRAQLQSLILTVRWGVFGLLAVLSLLALPDGSVAGWLWALGISLPLGGMAILNSGPSVSDDVDRERARHYQRTMHRMWRDGIKADEDGNPIAWYERNFADAQRRLGRSRLGRLLSLRIGYPLLFIAAVSAGKVFRLILL